MFELTNILTFSSFFILSIFLFFYFPKIFDFKTKQLNLIKPYPVIGHLFAFSHHKGDTLFQWFCGLIISSPSSTFVIHRPFGEQVVMTGNPANVEHILKTRFSNYEKGPIFRNTLKDLLGDGILNVDGDTWKFQRQVAIHEFNTKSLRKYIENVVDFELFNRLIPILTTAAKNKTVLDLQDILQRFTFDNICKIAFGYDPEYLSPSLTKGKFADALEDATMISTRRFRVLFPLVWKIRRFFNMGSEKRLKEAILEVREFARSLVKQRKNGINTSLENEDLLSRFLKGGHFEEENVIDIVIAFILGGRDTTSTALTWFFWILEKNKLAEEEIVREITKGGNRGDDNEENGCSSFKELKEMVYTHAALCESMRLYPPVPADTKQAETDDILPDGTRVRQGMRVSYFPYAMGRLESIWGSDWAEYRPERWLKEVNKDKGETKWRFVQRDAYSYPVFQAGVRTCIGKEMAFLQMKRVVAGILTKFRVIPVMEKGFEPVYVPMLTAKMEGGLRVRVQERME
ncbi:cytochrome P450 94A1-like [Silene latifolia]|uniref:cytochrome P450 94A1-like n=1 Tax=Silene latifolia TaxID=37657 RepID=UPI003D781A47